MDKYINTMIQNFTEQCGEIPNIIILGNVFYSRFCVELSGTNNIPPSSAIVYRNATILREYNFNYFVQMYKLPLAKIQE